LVNNPYGRQWTPPQASEAFSNKLIKADVLCIEGNVRQALELYQEESNWNSISARRLTIAKKQMKEGMTFTNENNRFDNRIKLGFIDWYQGFTDEEGILSMFQKAGIGAEYSSATHSDIIIAGTYGLELPLNYHKYRDQLIILFTGENISPSYNIHDFSITTRRNSYCGKNIRLPQWLGELNTDGKEVGIKKREQYDYTTTKAAKNLAITTIYNNSTPEREEMINLLKNEFGNDSVHVFGSQRGGNVNKFEILSRTVINMCFENSIGDGYTTEKLLHAKMMGCKALYWGDPGYKKDFTKENILNTYEISDLKNIISWCTHQLKDPGPIKSLPEAINQDIFNTTPNNQELIVKIREWSHMILNMRNFYSFTD